MKTQRQKLSKQLEELKKHQKEIEKTILDDQERENLVYNSHINSLYDRLLILKENTKKYNYSKCRATQVSRLCIKTFYRRNLDNC
tara:strand:+ start:536 stop:790 length:255 start_codon:yes stop_codon:yes gene_type:complete